MSDCDTAGRIRLLIRPAAENLITAGKRNHAYHPSGVDQSRILGTRIFTVGRFEVVDPKRPADRRPGG